MTNILRHVRLETGHTLRTFDTGRTCGGKTMLRYTFADPSGALLFDGEDFGCSPLHAIDADATLRGLLGFLTLRPGDTDRDYFAHYSIAQWEFAESSACDELQFFYSEEGPGEFVDIDEPCE